MVFAVRNFESFFGVEGWSSVHLSVDRTLKHYTRRTRSVSTRKNFLSALRGLCLYSGQINIRNIKRNKNFYTATPENPV